MNLMFQDRELKWEGGPLVFTPEQLRNRHEKLKQKLQEIFPKHINFTISFRDGINGMNMRTSTLLLQALDMKDFDETPPGSRSLEIVKILLSKGADPTIKGFYNGPIDPLEAANAKHDPELTKALDEATKAQADKK